MQGQGNFNDIVGIFVQWLAQCGVRIVEVAVNGSALFHNAAVNLMVSLLIILILVLFALSKIRPYCTRSRVGHIAFIRGAFTKT